MTWISIYINRKLLDEITHPCFNFSSLISWGLTHWGGVTHICIVKLTIIGSDNGLSPGRRQAIISTNAGILLIGPLWTNFSEILTKIQNFQNCIWKYRLWNGIHFVEIYTFPFRKMHLKMSFGKRRPFCLVLNVLKGPVGPNTERMACFLFDNMPWPKPMLIYFQLNHWEQTFNQILNNLIWGSAVENVIFKISVILSQPRIETTGLIPKDCSLKRPWPVPSQGSCWHGWSAGSHCWRRLI